VAHVPLYPVNGDDPTIRSALASRGKNLALKNCATSEFIPLTKEATVSR